MDKIIAREINPSYIDFSTYFDDDGLKSISGENCACYIPGDNRHVGFNNDEYQEIVKQAEEILDGFDDVMNNKDYYNTYKEVMEYCNISYTSHKCHMLKEWAKRVIAKNTYDTVTDDIAEYLTIITGEKWNCREFCGYVQGSYCEVIYCTAHYTEEHITEIGEFWLGCGTEFIIDDCGGYFIIDDIRWKEGELLKQTLADYYGCKPEDMEIYLYDGEHTISDYKLMNV